MFLTRRSALAALATAPLARRVTAAVTPAMLGSITGNEPEGYSRFATWYGRKPRIVLLAFNQMSTLELSNSTGWICEQAKKFMPLGAKILWSVPFPGRGQLEAVAAGAHDALYRSIMTQILDASPADTTGILVRLPWEFNLWQQENAAQDKDGKWDGPLFISAFRRIADITRQVSPRFQRIWCPNVTTMAIDPVQCWPGAGYVELVAQDFYMQKAYNKPGDFGWFRDEARGLAWGAAFAKRNGKRYGLSEWGMDDDAFVADFLAASSWLGSLGSLAHHHCWWDRPEVIDCRISDGTHPKLGAAFKQQFL